MSIAGNLLPLSPIPGFRFAVFFQGSLFGFQKLTGITREVETETYAEGGLNTKIHIFPKAVRGERILRLEKGVFSGLQHPFYIVGEKIDEPLHLVVSDALGVPLKYYMLTGAIVKKWEVGELQAQQNELLIDRFEISYEDMDIVV